MLSSVLKYSFQPTITMVQNAMGILTRELLNYSQTSHKCYEVSPRLTSELLVIWRTKYYFFPTKKIKL